MKRNFRNTHQRIISLIICFVFIFTSAIFNVNVFAENVSINFEDSGLELFTYSQDGGVEIITSDGNKYMNISPKVDGVATFAGYAFTPVQGTPTQISYDFMINKFMNNETTIASVSEGIDQFLTINVNDNKLAFKNSSGIYVGLIENLLVNKWYNLKLEMDFDNNKYSVYIDEECVLKDQTSLSSKSFISKEVKLSLSSKYSPGISVDNFAVGNVKDTSKIIIEGEKDILLADGEEATYEYTLNAYDADKVLIEDVSFEYIIRPDDGITASLDGNKLTLNILGDLPAGEFSIYVIGGKVVGNKTITLERYTPVSSAFEILGDGKLAFGYNKNTYPFTVKTTDQHGNRLEYNDVYYSLEGDVPDEVQLDGETGVITVTDELPKDHHLVLKAVDKNNPDVFATKNIVLMDGATYRSDKEIFDIVLNHIDQIYKYAQDPYNGTPLLAQAIDRLTLTPAYWYVTQDERYVPSNQAALSQFQRACDVIYMITGEEIYRDRIDESNKYFSENYVNSNGLPYWGGHTYVDLQTGIPNRDSKNVHELKGHDPYMESFFRVNPEFAENLCIAAFSQHITDWSTMDLSRHGYYDKPTDAGNFYSQVSEYVPSNVGYSPVYTTNLGFADALYGFSRLAIDLYKYNQNEYAATAFMKLFDAFWRVSSPDPDYWLDVPMNTTAGRKGYPDEAVQGLNEIFYGPVNPETGEHQWWLLDPVPLELQYTSYGDRFWRARGDDLIDQGYITEEEQWKARECYIIDEPEYNPQFLYWDFIDAVGEDHPYADIVIERAIRNCSNFIRMAYDENQNDTVSIMLIDGTDLTGFVCKRAGYYGGIGQTYGRGTAGSRFFAAACLTYSRSLKYPQYKEQSDIIWNFIRNLAERRFDLGVWGKDAAGDEATNVNIGTSSTSRDYLLSALYLYDATGNTQFLDLARAIAKNYVDEFTVDGFIVENVNHQYVYTGGRQSNGLYILTMLEAAIRGDFDKCPAYLEHTGFYEHTCWLEHLGEQSPLDNEYAVWQVPMPSVEPKRLELPNKEIEIKVGEIKKIEYKIYPSDAANKGVYIASSDTQCVTANLDNLTIQGIKPGTVEIVVRSTADIMIKDTIKVTVTE